MGCCGSKKYTYEEDTQRLRRMLIPIIWILGIPGSGKTTQCDLLVERYMLWKVSPKQIMEDQVHHLWSKRGKQLRKILKKNELISRQVMGEMLREDLLAYVDRCSGFLVDGFPRNLEQAEQFEELTAPPSMILFFKCPIKSAKTRLRNRWPGPCILDEPEASMKRRMQVFHSHIIPLLQKYKKRVVKIHADHDLATVYWECRKHIDKLFEKLGIEVPSAAGDELPFQLLPAENEDDHVF